MKHSWQANLYAQKDDKNSEENCYLFQSLRLMAYSLKLIFKHTLCIIILLLSTHSLWAQKTLHKEMKFVEHLVNKQYYNEAIIEISRLNIKKFTPLAQDSMAYFLGWSYYTQKQLQKSSLSFLKVSTKSTFYSKSRFFAAYNMAHIGNLQKANSILSNNKFLNKTHSELINFEQSGFSLLNRDIKEYNRYNKQIEKDLFAFSDQRKKMAKYTQEIQKFRPKKPWLGGLLSAIVPGSGKIYAGKTGEGLASMLMVTSMGLITWENYHKAGQRNFKTLFFGSVFSIFYIGNIYGSVFSVKIANDEFNNGMDKRILFNLHIPLRNYFN